jgi:phosphoglycolate phosphatase
MAANAFLFDLDGTLWDSHPWYATAARCASGAPCADFADRLRNGGNLVALIRELGLANATFTRSCEKQLSALRLFPKVRDVLITLSKQKMPMGIVTNLPEWIVSPALQSLGLGELFRARIFAARKPSPTGIVNGLALLSAKAKDAVYVGDTGSDCAAANAAGVPFAWAAYGYGNGCPEGASKVLRSFGDVLSL